MAKMIYDKELMRMVPAADVRASEIGNYEKISLDGKIFGQLEEFAKADGWDFSGESAVTVKGTDGKTKKDKEGNAIYEKDSDGNVKKVTVPKSKAKVTNAVRAYAEIAINDFIAARNVSPAPVSEPELEPEPEGTS